MPFIGLSGIEGVFSSERKLWAIASSIELPVRIGRSRAPARGSGGQAERTDSDPQRATEKATSGAR